DAVKELEKEFGLTFSFVEELLLDKAVNCQFQDAGWTEVVDCLFTPKGLQAEVLDGGYVVLKLLPLDVPRSWPICLHLRDEKGEGLPFVTIQQSGGGQGFTTDVFGRWNEPVIARPNDSLEFHFLGYAPQCFSIQDLSRSSCSNIQLVPMGIELASVVVTEYLTDGINATATGRPVLIAPQQIPALPGFAENEVYRSLSLLPGVNSPDETAGGLNIRGGGRDQNLVLWDGIPVYSSGHYFGMISPFVPELIDEVRIWRGQANAAFGGRLSGVIEMNTDRRVVDDWQVGVGGNLTHGSAYVKAPILPGRSDVHLAYRSSSNALLEGPTYASYRNQIFQGSALETFFPEDEFFTDSLFTGEQNFAFHEFNGRWQWNPSPQTRLTVSGFSQYDDFKLNLSAPFESGVYEDYFAERNWGVGLIFGQQLANRSELQLQVAWSDYNYLTGSSFMELRSSVSSERFSGIRDANARLDYRFKPRERDLLKIGLHYQNLDSYYEFGELDLLG
ncbi:MAG: TonB-dependent receptor, partial [Bacteroidota bacterium]